MKIRSAIRYIDLVPDFLRGCLWQILHLRCIGLLFLGRAAVLSLPRSAHVSGPIRLKDYSELKLGSTEEVTIGSMFVLGKFSIINDVGSPDKKCPHFRVGDNVSFGPYCQIGGGYGFIMGSNIAVGGHVSIHPENHGHGRADIFIKDQGTYGHGISLGSDIWIGQKVTILDGTILGDRMILGACCLVNKSFTGGHVIAGVPAAVLKAI